MSLKLDQWLSYVDSSTQKAINAFKNNPNDQPSALVDLLTATSISSQKKAQFLQHKNGILSGKPSITDDQLFDAFKKTLEAATQPGYTKEKQEAIVAAFLALNSQTQARLFTKLSAENQQQLFEYATSTQKKNVFNHINQQPLKDQANLFTKLKENDQKLFLGNLSSNKQVALFQELVIDTQKDTLDKLKPNAQLMVLTSDTVKSEVKKHFLQKVDDTNKNTLFKRVANTSETKQQQFFNALDLKQQTEYLQYSTGGIKIGPLRLTSDKPIHETTTGQNLFKNIAGKQSFVAKRQAEILNTIDLQAATKLFDCLSTESKAHLLNYANENINALANNLFNSLSFKQQKNLLLSDKLDATTKGELFAQLDATKKQTLLTGFYHGFNDTQRKLFFNSLKTEHQANVLHDLHNNYTTAKALLFSIDNDEIKNLQKQLSAAKSPSEKQAFKKLLENAYEAQGKKQGEILQALYQQNPKLTQELFNSDDMRLPQRVGILRALNNDNPDSKKIAIELMSNMKPQQTEQQAALFSQEILNLETQKEAFNNIKNAYTQTKVLTKIQENLSGKNSNLPNELFKHLAKKNPTQTAAVLFHLNSKLASHFFQQTTPAQQANILSELIDKKHPKTAERLFKSLATEEQIKLLISFPPEPAAQKNRNLLFEAMSSNHKTTLLISLLTKDDSQKQVGISLFQTLAPEQQAQVLKNSALDASNERKILFDSLKLEEKIALFNTEIFNSDTRRELFSQEPIENQAAIIKGTKDTIIRKFARDLGDNSATTQANIIEKLDADKARIFFRGLDKNPKLQATILEQLPEKDAATLFKNLKSPGQQIKILNRLDTEKTYSMIKDLDKAELATIFNRTMLHPNHLDMKNAQTLFFQLAKEQPDKAIHVLNEGSGLLGRGKELFKALAKKEFAQDHENPIENNNALQAVKAILSNDQLKEAKAYFKALPENIQLELATEKDHTFRDKFKAVHKIKITDLVNSQNNMTHKHSNVAKHKDTSNAPTISMTTGNSEKPIAEESVAREPVALGRVFNK